MNETDASVWVAVYRVVYVIFILLNLAVFGLFAFALVKLWGYRPKIHPERHAGNGRKITTLADAIVKERWAGVAKKYSSGRPDELKLAVIEADKIADDILKRLGLEGQHMADRLGRISPEELGTLNRLWRAHRLRNDLVHTPGFALTPEAAKGAIADYEAFLKEIGAL